MLPHLSILGGLRGRSRLWVRGSAYFGDRQYLFYNNLYIKAIVKSKTRDRTAKLGASNELIFSSSKRDSDCLCTATE